MSDNTQHGTAGTENRPLEHIATEDLTVDGVLLRTLLGIETGTTPATGHLAFDGTSGDFSGAVTVGTEAGTEVVTSGTVVESGQERDLVGWHIGPNPVDFQVTITGTNSPVSVGDTLTVDAQIDNQGSQKATQTVDLVVDGATRDGQSVTLGVATSTTISLSWATKSGDGGTYTATVASDDGSDSKTVAVQSGGVPNSVIHQYRAEDFASPWPDAVGSVDMTVSGLSSATFPNGEVSVESDGNDAGTADGPEALPSNKTFGLAFTFRLTAEPDDSHSLLGSRDTSGRNNDFFVRIEKQELAGETPGSLDLSLSDGVNDKIRIFDDVDHRDGDIYAIVINKTGNSASDIDFYVDDMSTPVDTKAQTGGFDHTEYSNDYNIGFFDITVDRSLQDSNLPAEVGVFEFNADTYSQSERDDFVTRRPEV